MVESSSISRTLEWADRLTTARRAVESVGPMLLEIRKKRVAGIEGARGQLKTEADRLAEDWVLGILKRDYPDDCFLAEESFEEAGRDWEAPREYWTVDALDGTRSFVEGFDGFCSQAAYVVEGEVKLGVVYEPVRRVTYQAIAGQGAFRRKDGGKRRRLAVRLEERCPLIFIDSTRPTGPVGRLLTELSGEYLECGSIGLKICRVADGTADIFAKALTFKLWDTAPGDLILREAGGRLGLWTGEPIPYHGRQVYFRNLLAAPAGLFAAALPTLRGFPVDKEVQS